MHYELSYRLEVPGLLLFACLGPAAGGDITVRIMNRKGEFRFIMRKIGRAHV